MSTPSPTHDYHKSHAYHSTSAVGASAVEEIEAHHQEHEQAAKVVEESRGGGVSTFDYLISLMGYAIGIGNVWRFPYLVGRNGGCAFVVAYLICLFLIASPMYLLELIWGNTSRRNPIGTFRMMSPRFVGVAYASVALLVFVVSYYNMLLSYALIYLVNSFYSPLPWTYEALPPNKRHDLSPSEHFYYNEVLARYDPGVVTRAEFDGLGALQWPLVLGLLVVYMIVFLTLFRGMEASAKVTYVTVGLPVALIVVLFIRGITLDGASDGIEFYIGKFEWSKLGKIDVWADAAGQILFSLSPGMGTAITLSSYTKKKEDVYKINILVTICNSCFSLFAGFAVFSILGFMSKRRCDEVGLECVSVDELASKSGSGLAFIVLAEGVSMFGSGSNVFSLFFFFMLLTLGLDSTFAWMETLITYSDDWVTERRTRLGGLEWCTKPVIVGMYCVFFFLVGLLYCTPLGGPLLDVVDNWAGSYIMIAICFFESLMLSWWWTWDRLVLNLQNATKGLPGLPNGRVLGRFSYWRVTMMFTAPVLCLMMFIFRLVKNFDERYGDYPDGIIAIGWLSLVTCLICIPIGAIINWNEPADAIPEYHDDDDAPSFSQPGLAAGMQSAGNYVAPDKKDVEQPMQPHIQMFFQDDAQRDAGAEPAPPVPNFPHPLTQTSTNALGQPYTVADASPVKTCPLTALSQRSTSASATAAGPVL